MKVGVLLAGCGVYDGSEIQEAVLTLLAIEEIGAEAVCISVDENQYHVVNHLDGSVSNEQRNMLVESARIARGKVTEISKISPSEIDALVIPGGFGNAKNWTTWAFDGPQSSIVSSVKLLIVNMINVGKPIVSLCVSPIVLAKALEDSGLNAQLSMGNVDEKSEYDIAAFHAGIESVGASAQQVKNGEVWVDETLNIISAPCYMMDISISELNKNIQRAVNLLKDRMK